MLWQVCACGAFENIHTTDSSTQPLNEVEPQLNFAGSHYSLVLNWFNVHAGKSTPVHACVIQTQQLVCMCKSSRPTSMQVL